MIKDKIIKFTKIFSFVVNGLNLLTSIFFFFLGYAFLKLFILSITDSKNIAEILIIIIISIIFSFISIKYFLRIDFNKYCKEFISRLILQIFIIGHSLIVTISASYLIFSMFNIRSNLITAGNEIIEKLNTDWTLNLANLAVTIIFIFGFLTVVTFLMSPIIIILERLKVVNFSDNKETFTEKTILYLIVFLVIFLLASFNDLVRIIPFLIFPYLITVPLIFSLKSLIDRKGSVCSLVRIILKI